MDITIKNGLASVVCQTHGAQLLSYQTSEGKEYIWQRDEAYWGKSSPVLFPFIGPVSKPVVIHGKSYDMPRHGFVKDAEFQVVEQGDDFVVLKTEMSEFSSSVYPYDFEFTVTFRLNGARLEVVYGVVNRGSEEMPFLIGGHPAFFCPMEEGEKFTDYILHFEDADKEDVHLEYSLFDEDAIFFENFKQRTVELIHQETKKGIHFEFPGHFGLRLKRARRSFVLSRGTAVQWSRCPIQICWRKNMCSIFRQDSRKIIRFPSHHARGEGKWHISF